MLPVRQHGAASGQRAQRTMLSCWYRRVLNSVLKLETLRNPALWHPSHWRLRHPGYDTHTYRGLLVTTQHECNIMCWQLIWYMLMYAQASSVRSGGSRLSSRSNLKPSTGKKALSPTGSASQGLLRPSTAPEPTAVTMTPIRNKKPSTPVFKGRRWGSSHSRFLLPTPVEEKKRTRKVGILHLTSIETLHRAHFSQHKLCHHAFLILCLSYQSSALTFPDWRHAGCGRRQEAGGFRELDAKLVC